MNCQFPSTAKGTPCRACGWKLPRDYETAPERNCNGPPCRNLGAFTNESATVVSICFNGKKVKRYYAIHSCAVFGECLPDFTCTRESKEALAEWMEKSGREAEIATCRGCESFARMPP